MTGHADTHAAYVEAARALREAMNVGSNAPRPLHDRPNKLRYPDFLVIGAQKAGTTWLHDNLKSHPEIWLPPVKELNHFNQMYQPSPDGWESTSRIAQALDIKSYFEADQSSSGKYHSKRAALDEILKNECTDESYGRIFSHAGDDQLCGEISPDYALLPRVAISRVLGLNPAVKIVLILRDPIARAWSHVKMEAARMGGVDPVSLLFHPNWVSGVRGRSNYPAMIKRWAGFVSPPRMSVLSYDGIADDPLSFLCRLCSFLSIHFDARFFPDTGKIVHGAPSSVDIPENALKDLRATMRFIYDGLMELCPEIATPWVRQHYG